MNNEKIIESINDNLPNNAAIQSNALVDIFPYVIVRHINDDIAHEFYPYGPSTELSNDKTRELGLFSDIIRAIHFFPRDSDLYRYFADPERDRLSWGLRMLLLIIPRFNLANAYWKENTFMPQISIRKGTRVAADSITCASLFVEFRMSQFARYKSFIKELIRKIEGLNTRLEKLMKQFRLRKLSALENKDFEYDECYTFTNPEIYQQLDFESIFDGLHYQEDGIYKVIKCLFRSNEKYLRLLRYYEADQVKLAYRTHTDSYVRRSTLDGFYTDMQLSKFPSSKLFKGLPRTTTARILQRKYKLYRFSRTSVFEKEKQYLDSQPVFKYVEIDHPFVHIEPDENTYTKSYYVRDFSFFYRNSKVLEDDVAVTVEMPAPVDFPSLVELFTKSGFLIWPEERDGFWTMTPNYVGIIEDVLYNMKTFLQTNIKHAKPVFVYNFIQM